MPYAADVRVEPDPEEVKGGSGGPGCADGQDSEVQVCFSAPHATEFGLVADSEWCAGGRGLRSSSLSLS